MWTLRICGGFVPSQRHPPNPEAQGFHGDWVPGSIVLVVMSIIGFAPADNKLTQKKKKKKKKPLDYQTIDTW